MELEEIEKIVLDEILNMTNYKGYIEEDIEKLIKKLNLEMDYSRLEGKYEGKKDIAEEVFGESNTYINKKIYLTVKKSNLIQVKIEGIKNLKEPEKKITDIEKILFLLRMIIERKYGDFSEKKLLEVLHDCNRLKEMLKDKDFKIQYKNLMNIVLKNIDKTKMGNYIKEKGYNYSKEEKCYIKEGYELKFLNKESRDSECNYIGKILKEIDNLIENEEEVEYFFRGQTNSEWNVEAGIFRDKELIENEDRIYKEVLSLKPEYFRENKYVYENLLTIQHFEGVTRLIDITGNPLVAIFFACAGNSNKDGKIFIYKEKKDKINYMDSDKVLIVSNLVNMGKEFKYNSCRNKKRLLHSIKDSKPQFEDNINENDLYKSYIVRGIMSNKRIINQKGDFIIVGMKKDSKVEAAEITQETKKAIIIDAGCKKEILEELKRLNINGGTIYPELTKINKYLKENYTNKNKGEEK